MNSADCHCAAAVLRCGATLAQAAHALGLGAAMAVVLLQQPSAQWCAAASLLLWIPSIVLAVRVQLDAALFAALAGGHVSTAAIDQSLARWGFIGPAKARVLAGKDETARAASAVRFFRYQAASLAAQAVPLLIAIAIHLRTGAR